MPRAARGRPNQSNAHDGKLWRDAVRVASLVVDDNDPLKRRRIHIAAEALLNAACDGDVAAMREIGDRLDGKAVQAIEAVIEERRSVIRAPEPARTANDWTADHSPSAVIN